MKLRNKKTGEIVEDTDILGLLADAKYDIPLYRSLTELNEEWEDYEEPSKTIWQIKDSGELQDFEEDDFSDGYIESSKSIGNYFETREEAEKAVEKLKAWKRLKDKGFEFRWIDKESGNIKYAFYLDKHDMINRFDYEDLDFLFGGEE